MPVLLRSLMIVLFQIGAISCQCNGVYRPLTGIVEHCFWMITTLQNGTTSNQLCKDSGGTLAVVNSIEVQRFIETLYNSVPAGTQFYIGVHDMNTNGVFETFTNEKQVFFKWDNVSYTPPGKTSTECVVIDVNSDFRWREMRCFFNKKALCSKEIPLAYLSSYISRIASGVALTGHEVLQIDDVGLYKCAFACQKNENCRSLNYDAINRRCVINDATSTQYPASLNASPTVSHFGILY